MAEPYKFGELLTKAIRYIGAEENKNLSIIQDELGYKLGRKGRSVIEHWRKGNIPPTDKDTEMLARELVKRSSGSLNGDWLEEFLSSADYSNVDELCDELFPMEQAHEEGQQLFIDSDEAVSTRPTDNAPSPILAHEQVLVWISKYKLGIVTSFVIMVVIVFAIWMFISISDPNEGAEITPTAEPTSVTQSASIPEATPIPVNETSLCGESMQLEDVPSGEDFIRHEGVTTFNTENTPNGILNNNIRSVAVAPHGILLGYHNLGSTNVGGLTYLEFDERKWFWANCNEANITEGLLVNSIAVDQQERIWVGTDGGGVLLFDGTDWTTYTAENSNLPQNAVFGLSIDDDNTIWAATWGGIARFDGAEWTAVYNTEDELTKNPAHNIAFDSTNNIWIGHVLHGVTQFDAANGTWILYQEGEGTIGGNNVRGIVVREETDTSPESVWFATDGGGVTKYEEGNWTVYGVKDGLPSEEVRTVALDIHGRIWVGTVEGASYFDGANWHTYHSLSTLSIAFLPGCDEPTSCPDDHVWTATEENGLTHSRLPYPDQVLDVKRICFLAEDREPECPELVELSHPHIITATYSQPLSLGDEFYFEIEASPRGGYELNGNSDFLLHIDVTEDTLFGSHHNVPIDGIISSGQFFKFSFNDRRMTVPTLPEGESEATFVSPWRAWVRTRYAGPEIHIVFTVKES